MRSSGWKTGPDPRVRARSRWTRRLALPTVVFFCAAATAQPAAPANPPADEAELVPATEPTSTTQPATAPAAETFATAQTRTARPLPDGATQRERDAHAAVRAALAMLAAMQRGDHAAAAKSVDTTGFHVLPLNGPLPERPEKPLIGEALTRRLTAAPRVDAEALRGDHVRIVTGRDARERFPALYRWMLVNDALVELYTPAGQSPPTWRRGPVVLVVRLRAGTPTVIGGNLFEALAPAPVPDDDDGPLPGGEDK